MFLISKNVWFFVKSVIAIRLLLYTDYSEDIFFKVNETSYSPGNITLVQDTAYLVECISYANPAVSCTITTANVEDGASETCFYNVESSYGQDTLSLKCIVENSVSELNNLFISNSLIITFIWQSSSLVLV